MYKSKRGAEKRQEELFFALHESNHHQQQHLFIVHVVKLKIEGKTFAALFFVAFCVRSLRVACVFDNIKFS